MVAVAGPLLGGPPDARFSYPSVVKSRAVGSEGVPAPPLVCCLEGTSPPLDDDLAREAVADAPLLGLDGLSWAMSAAALSRVVTAALSLVRISSGTFPPRGLA